MNKHFPHAAHSPCYLVHVTVVDISFDPKSRRYDSMQTFEEVWLPDEVILAATRMLLAYFQGKSITQLKGIIGQRIRVEVPKDGLMSN